jgi:hypothetical protein
VLFSGMLLAGVPQQLVCKMGILPSAGYSVEIQLR